MNKEKVFLPFLFLLGFFRLLACAGGRAGQQGWRQPVDDVAEQTDSPFDEHPQAKADFHPEAGFGACRGGDGFRGGTALVPGCTAFGKLHRGGSLPQKAEGKLNQSRLHPGSAGWRVGGTVAGTGDTAYRCHRWRYRLFSVCTTDKKSNDGASLSHPSERKLNQCTLNQTENQDEPT